MSRSQRMRTGLFAGCVGLLVASPVPNAAQAQEVVQTLECRYFTGEIVSRRPLDVDVSSFLTDAIEVEPTVVQTNSSLTQLQRVGDSVTFDGMAVGALDDAFVRAAVELTFARIQEIPEVSGITCPATARVRGNGTLDAALLEEEVVDEFIITENSLFDGTRRVGVLEDCGALGLGEGFCSVMATRLKIRLLGEADLGFPRFRRFALKNNEIYFLAEGEGPRGQQGIYLGCDCVPELEGMPEEG